MGRVLAVIIWILTLLSVLLFVAGKWWFPEAISEHAPALDRQFMITISSSVFPSPPPRLVWAGWSGSIATPASRRRSRRLLARQQSSRSALDDHHRGDLHRLG
jgi:hypothetical protein